MGNLILHSEMYIADIQQGGQSILESGIQIGRGLPEPVEVILRRRRRKG